MKTVCVQDISLSMTNTQLTNISVHDTNVNFSGRCGISEEGSTV